MKILLTLLLALPGLASAMAQLDLNVQLDPASRLFLASARISDSRDIPGFRLAPEFEIVDLTANGRRIAARAKSDAGDYALPAGSREVEIRYRATLAPLVPLDHREVLTDKSAVADLQGSYLPAASGWYPDVGTFRYRLRLALPPGQKGLVPGKIVDESDGPEGYRAEFEFGERAEGISLMAGPYVLAERRQTLASGRDVIVRTWFHPEIAELAPGYLEDSARYIERYSQEIGEYPFAMFSIVSSPTPTGFGMAGLTYLGRDVLRLPFIRASSLGHEILHNWWGNGVYPDWARGNWSEGLTTYLADYAYKRDIGEDAAREMRLGWLRDLAALPSTEDRPLKDFTSRHGGASSIVGYDKSAMLFLMLEDEVGHEAFTAALRSFWQRYRFRTAGWDELAATFSATTGKPLTAFFRQWVSRAGAPSPRISFAVQRGNVLMLNLAGTDGYALGVSPRLTFADRSEWRRIHLKAGATAVALRVNGQVKSVELDPDYRLWRHVDTTLLPPVLRETFVALKTTLVMVGDDPALQDAALALVNDTVDVKPEEVLTTFPEEGAAVIVGRPAAIDAWLARHLLPPRPAPAEGTAQVWAGRYDGHTYVVLSVDDVAALQALARPLPHYGKQSWLVFDGPRVTAKGIWPPRTEVMPVSMVQTQTDAAADASR